ncbi:imidazolonepropionase [Sediminitomix flava]|uniref:Imidazolonepropionase n=1 Tax=Sediminitomix flava TaxID=379075 RepID=A0A315ZHJ2_SEDFL|nr:imidazolonepropionase [Sediminitomix flava]PWJ44762.1 imidazolonepropionase [Sediminitomix flava]
MKTVIGPFTEIISLKGLPQKGALQDEQLQIDYNAAIVVEDDKIIEIGPFNGMLREHPEAKIESIEGPHVLLPGFVDCHTHICWAGNRAQDYAMRIAGKSYLDIAKAGGGIWDSVTQTRKASEAILAAYTKARAKRHLLEGITTIEVKSGYALSEEDELKMLRAIKKANDESKADLVSTCLSAHIKPKDFEGDEEAYLNMILEKILPVAKAEGLTNRVDIFIEDSAFSTEKSKPYLEKAKAMGFDITVHADQFTTGGSKVAVEVGALGAEHLEATSDEEIELLANSDTVAVALPGASVGLGEPFTPARKLLDKGAAVAIASDWNPGSAPMGDLLTQAAILSTFQKLSTAEVFAGLTFRAAKALNLEDRGTLENGKLADFQAYATDDFRNILYQQGKMKPAMVWKKGERVK